MASIPSERIAMGGGSAAQQERLICFILFIYLFLLHMLTPYPPRLQQQQSTIGKGRGRGGGNQKDNGWCGRHLDDDALDVIVVD
jgi:hypothetical protein